MMGTFVFKRLNPADVRKWFYTLFQAYEKRLNLEEFGDPDEEFTQRKIVAKFLAKVNYQVNFFTADIYCQ